LGGSIKTASRVERIADLPKADLTMCDLTPRQLLTIAGEHLSQQYRRRLQHWNYGAAVFKVDYALREPIPWRATDCKRAATVHISGTFGEIAASEKAMRNGRHAERPFVLLAQPSLFDRSRAPEGNHTAWAYCHVPNGSTFDMLPRLEAQIERFAPGFEDCILARRVFSPAALEAMDANLIGGDINGGAANLLQFLFRPTGAHYATSAPDIYICSSSTPPGGGVHGMCGFNAANLALARTRRKNIRKWFCGFFDLSAHCFPFCAQASCRSRLSPPATVARRNSAGVFNWLHSVSNSLRGPFHRRASMLSNTGVSRRKVARVRDSRASSQLLNWESYSERAFLIDECHSCQVLGISCRCGYRDKQAAAAFFPHPGIPGYPSALSPTTATSRSHLRKEESDRHKKNGDDEIIPAWRCRSCDLRIDIGPHSAGLKARF